MRGFDRYPWGMRWLIFLILGLSGAAHAQGPVRPNHDYLVVASNRARATDGWRQVIGALAARHDAEMLFYEQSPTELLPELKRRHPRLVGVVAMPDEAGRDQVGAFNRLFRKIDDDPWLDVRWGMVTASGWEDAMDVVRTEKPLEVRRMLSNTPVPLEVASDGTYFDEGVAGRRMERRNGEEPQELLGDKVIADLFAERFNKTPPDLLVTSGRTNEERWMLGYNFDGGRVVVSEEGDLRTRTPDGVEVPLRHSGPMAMLGAGSCLLGYVPDDTVLPLAFIRDGGARQIIGYASTTWHGAGGWDVYRRFLEEPGRNTLAEATWLAQQDLVRRFHAEFPEVEPVSTEGFSEREVPEFRAAVTEATGMDRLDPRFHDLAGYLWDRDAMVIIGDPAWAVRLESGPLPWTSEMRRDGDRLLIDLEVREDLTEVATPILILPDRVMPRGIIDGGGIDPELGDDLVFLPGLKDQPVGASLQIVLDAPLREPPKQTAAPSAEDIDAVLARHEQQRRAVLRRQIERAGPNAGALLTALREVPEEHRSSMAYLVAGMPPADLRHLPADVLLENVALAHASFEGSPFASEVPEEVFLDAVLPYAHINERRDDWRGEFTDRFRDPAWGFSSQEDAVRHLNKVVYETYGVSYDANKRFKNEQSPYQTIDQNCASCTGLSIMLANACRAAGIPARLAGIPEWPTGDNHTWVEVWDDGRWRWVEALAPGEYDQAWWVGKVGRIAAEDHQDPRHRIWAATWSRPEGLPNRFPLWWLEESDDPIPGEDRTDAYAMHAEPEPDTP